MRTDKTDLYSHPSLEIDLRILKAEGREIQVKQRFQEEAFYQDEWLQDEITLEIRFVEHTKESLLEKLEQLRIALEVFLDQEDELILPTANRLEDNQNSLFGLE